MAAPDLTVAALSANQNTRLGSVTNKMKAKPLIAPIPEELPILPVESDATSQGEATSILCPVCNMHIDPNSFAIHQNRSGCFKTLENRRRVESNKSLALDLRSHRENLQLQRHQTSLEERKIKREFYTKQFGNSLSTRRRALSAGCVPITSQDNFRIGGTQLGSSFSRSGSSFRVTNGVTDLTKYSRSMRTTSTHTCKNCSSHFLSRVLTPTHALRPKSAVVPCYHCPNWELVRTGLQGQL
ncbi:hypothetical protein LOD99_5556 [Oopsacas minuta]|uniref:Uncharacterized protein n=1 Tax=Oopsacas minuta TaxID=111878 RepID=A0AAV7JR78_9METZ|nr:hypothetical protein LOD99_5556 [Oopsacas minuta]